MDGRCAAQRRARLVAALVALSLGSANAGCFSFGVRAPHVDVTTQHSTTLHAYLWNLVEPDPVAVAESCGGRALSQVRAKTNYVYLLVGVLTAGAWLPMEMEWRCAGESGAR